MPTDKHTVERLGERFGIQIIVQEMKKIHLILYVDNTRLTWLVMGNGKYASRKMPV